MDGPTAAIVHSYWERKENSFFMVVYPNVFCVAKVLLRELGIFLTMEAEAVRIFHIV